MKEYKMTKENTRCVLDDGEEIYYPVEAPFADKMVYAYRQGKSDNMKWVIWCLKHYDSMDRDELIKRLKGDGVSKEDYNQFLWDIVKE